MDSAGEADAVAAAIRNCGPRARLAFGVETPIGAARITATWFAAARISARRTSARRISARSIATAPLTAARRAVSVLAIGARSFALLACVALLGARAAHAQVTPPFERGLKVEVGETRDKNGQVVRHGDYRASREDGSLAWTGQYEEGLRVGTWTAYHANGRVAASGQYVLDGLKNHLWECYWPNGTLRARGKYRLDLRDGPWKFINPDKSTNVDDSGEYAPLLDKWDEDNPKKLRADRRDGVVHGRVSAYWRNGSAAFEGRAVNGRRSGNWRFRHADGTLDDELLSGWYEDGYWTGPLRAETADAAGAADTGTPNAPSATDVADAAEIDTGGALPQEQPDVGGAAEPRLTMLSKLRLNSLKSADARAIEQSLASAVNGSPDAWTAAKDELASRGRVIAPAVWNAWLEAAKAEAPDVRALDRYRELLASVSGVEYDALLATPVDSVRAARLAVHRWSALLRITEASNGFDAAELDEWGARRTPETRNAILSRRFDAWIGLPKTLNGQTDKPAADAQPADVASAKPTGGANAAARTADQAPRRRVVLTPAEQEERDKRYAEDRAAEAAADAAAARESIRATNPLANQLVDRSVDWLLRHQLPSGEFPTQATPSRCKSGSAPCSSFGPAALAPATTALAVLALKGAPPGTRDASKRAAIASATTWLIAQQDAVTGTFGEREPDHFPFQQAVCTWALCEVARGSTDAKVRAAARSALDACIATHSSGGGWGYPRHAGNRSTTTMTAWTMLALEAAQRAKLAVPSDVLADAAKWVRAVTDEHTTRIGDDDTANVSSRITGKYDMHDPTKGEPTTAAGLIVRLIAGDLDVAHLGRDDFAGRQEFMVHARAPRWSPSTSDCDTFHWYFGAQALCRMRSNKWAAWWKRLVEQAGLALGKDACAAGSVDPVDPWGSFAGRVYSTAIVALALETELAQGEK